MYGKTSKTSTANETASAMTSTEPSLFIIGYARTTCSVEQVKQVFNYILDEDIVTTVDERVKTDPKGYEFKIFFVHFSRTNHRLEQMKTRIAKEGFVALVYNTKYDKKRGECVERYWKVTCFTPKPTGIRIMTEEEAASLELPKRTKSPKGSKSPKSRGGGLRTRKRVRRH